MTLSFDATVNRRLAHKAALENVFITDVAAVGGARLAAARLPRMHKFHNDPDGPYHDLLLIAEVARQGVAAIVHQLMGVPLSHRFVITEMRIEARDLEMLPMDRACEMIIDFRAERERRRRDGILRAVTGKARCLIAGAHAAEFTGTAVFLPAETYDAVREDEREDEIATAMPAMKRADPLSVGRREETNAVISVPMPSSHGLCAHIAADPRHAVFFDHAQDHYPGMLVLEACRQLALALAAHRTGRPAAGFRLTSCGGAFTDFAELGAPVLLDAAGTDQRVEVCVQQRDSQLAVIDLELRRMVPS